MYKRFDVIKDVISSTTPPGNVDYTKAKYLATALLTVNDIVVTPAKNIIEFNNDFLNKYSREISNICRDLTTVVAMDVGLVTNYVRVICQHRAMFHSNVINSVFFSLDFSTALTLLDKKYPDIEFNEDIFTKCMDILVGIIPPNGNNYEAAIGNCLLDKLTPNPEDVRNAIGELDIVTKDKEILHSQTMALLHIYTDVLTISRDVKIDRYTNDNYNVNIWKFVLNNIFVKDEAVIVNRALVLLGENSATRSQYSDKHNTSNAERVLQVRMGTYV